MTIIVSAEDLAQMNALRKMQKAFPDEVAQFKARKKEWWARVRAAHNIPSSAKIKLGTETGVILDSDTGQAYELPAKKMWLRIPGSAIAEYLADAVDDGAFYEGDDCNSETAAEGTFGGTSDIGPRLKRDGYNNFYVQLDY